ncbi:MAG: 3-hydroxybutyryl-CoA dehydrogenase [Deltaproteobacteria bacterium]|nr:3-hydroxybutyryl-CoA dehydrogenase [Deltaproteobacteria bacterium]
MSVQSVFVVGAGTMGHGIAQVCAAAGLSVKIADRTKDLTDKGVARIAKGVERLVQKDKMTAADKDALLGRITPAPDLSGVADVDLVIEAVFEDLDVKTAVFAELGKYAKPETILATNTSSLSITKLATTVDRPERVIGMHFFNPVPVMKLIEVIRALQTDDATYQVIHDLSIQLGKSPVEIKDSPGFAANRVLMMLINEAIFCVYENIGTPEAIDTVMKLGMNHPMGPLALADLVGLDVCLAVMQRLYSGFSDSKFRPCPLLISMVEAGRLGRKTGRGFYEY